MTAFEWGISPSTIIDANGWLQELGVYFSTGGYYQIYARAKNSCGYGSSTTQTLNIYVYDNCTGGMAIKDKAKTVKVTEDGVSDFSLYPNPVGDVLYLYTPNTIDIKHCLLRIVDMSGRMVKNNMQISKGQTIVDISNLAKGAYIVEINDGKKVYSKKVIKN